MAGDGGGPGPALEGFHHLNLTVRDLERSAAWYVDVLGFNNVKHIRCPGFDRVLLRHPVGGFFLGLTQHRPGRAGGRFDERRVGMDHVAFTLADLGAAQTWERRLRGYGVECSEIKVSETGAVLTLRDPDNVQLELHVPAEGLPPTTGA